jgi:chitin disaccharide deacetylase
VRRALIITADDFGLHEAINEAVSRANSQGVLTSASLMVAAPASEEAVRRARELPGLRVGLHLVLTNGVAALPQPLIPALVDARGRFDERMWLEGLRFFALRRVRAQLAAEIRAQFAAFKATGLVLDHVNAHKHFHLHPTILQMIVDIGREYGLRAVRVPDEPFWFAARAGGTAGAVSTLFLSPWVARMKRVLRASGIACNDRIFGNACSGRMTESELLQILARLPPGLTEIYLHPAAPGVGPSFSPSPGYLAADELAGMLSPRVAAAVHASDATCGGYRDMAHA